MPAYRHCCFSAGFCFGLFALWSVAVAQGPLPTMRLVGLLSGETQRLAVVEMSGARSSSSVILGEGEAFYDVSIAVIDPVGGIVRFRKQGSTDLQEWKLPGSTAAGPSPNAILLKDAEPNTVIAVYQHLARRTVLRGPVLPRSGISLSANTSLENLIGALESTLATNGVTIRPAGELFAFAVRNDQAETLASLPVPPVAAPEGRQTRMYRNTIVFEQADHSQVLELYQELAGRTVLQGPNIAGRKYTFRNETELTRAEGTWLMASLFRIHGLAVLPQGSNLVIVALAGHTNGLPRLEGKPALRDDAPMTGAAIQFSEALPQQLLELYVSLAGGTAGSVSPRVPQARISLRNPGPMTRREAIYAIEALAALHGFAFQKHDSGRVDLLPLMELREK